MPIKTKISVDADSEKIKASLAEFEKYRAALAQMYGGAALKAPHIAAASAAGGDLLKFIDLDQAARSQSAFASGSSKASRAFHSLHTGIQRLVERQSQSSAMSGLMPGGMRGLEGIGVLAGPIGLIAMTLFGVGVAAGVAGIAAFRGLASGAAGVSDRRRFAMGIGSGYGEVAGFDLDFSRFGADQGTLGAVAGGLYDVTSPQRIGLMTAGVTGGKDAVETAVELIRKIPQMLKGVDDGAVGPVAKSMGLTDILDLPTIVRLRNHPEEIEGQVKKFQGDKITLDMSAKATEAWASFNAELERDGLKIETALGKSLVGLTPGLTHLSEEMVDVVGELIKSDALKNGLKGAESGLERLGGYLGSDRFKHAEDGFLAGIAALEPYADKIGFIAKLAYKGLGLTDEVLNGILAAAQGNGAALRDWLIKKFGLDFLTGGISGIHTGGPDAPGLTGTGSYSLRYYAGHGGDRPKYGGVVDEGDGTETAPVGAEGAAVLDAEKMVGASEVADQAKLKEYLRTGGVGMNPRDLAWCAGFVNATLGHEGIKGTGSLMAGSFARWGQGVAGKDVRAGDVLMANDQSHVGMAEGSARMGPNGLEVKMIAGNERDSRFAPGPSRSQAGMVGERWVPLSEFTVRRAREVAAAEAASAFAMPARPHSTSHMPIGGPLELPGSKPAQAVGERLHFDNRIGIRNRALRDRGRSLHILDHVAPPPPKPVTIQDHSGGMVQFSIA
jgi:hypothetical protein